MARTNDDKWEITKSVGATALGMAAARAAETRNPNPLIDDPYAELFVKAAGEGTWSIYLSEQVADASSNPYKLTTVQARLHYIASRTKFFDDFFLTAVNSGIRQMVILAAGLDSRAWRLSLPEGVTVYEIDQPKVLQFKQATLDAHRAEPTTKYVPVPIDLRRDWPTALRLSGFDSSLPTAWSAEGLLPYVSSGAQDLLFDRIHALSTFGSTAAIDAFATDYFDASNLDRQRALAEAVPDTAGLFYFEERTDLAQWLSKHGWIVDTIAADALVARNHRQASADVRDATPRSVFIEARLS
jgi:methyltransferase (TIGR00027 family)